MYLNIKTKKAQGQSTKSKTAHLWTIFFFLSFLRFREGGG